MTEDDVTELARTLGRLAKRRGVDIATAESCTGGGVATAITRISGSAKYFDRAFVTYTNLAKKQMLGVAQRTLANNGAVSEPVAREMAEGVRTKTGATFAISVTGIAGPTGGTAEKPVGTVFIGLATPEKIEVKQMLNQYDRETFKFLTSQQALDLVRRELLKA